MQSHKVCRKCGIEKSEYNFSPHSGTGDKLRNICNECHADYMREHCRKRYATPYGRARQMYNSAKSRSLKRGIEFNLTFDLLWAKCLIGICEKSGLPFKMTPPVKSKYGPLSPSLDRINPKIGYVDHNIQVVCNMFNMGKSDYDEIDYLAICVAVAERHKNDPFVVMRLKEIRGE